MPADAVAGILHQCITAEPVLQFTVTAELLLLLLIATLLLPRLCCCTLHPPVPSFLLLPDHKVRLDHSDEC